jgi:hypothetical protein
MINLLMEEVSCMEQKELESVTEASPSRTKDWHANVTPDLRNHLQKKL